MTHYIYEHTLDVQIDEVTLNGEQDAIEVYAHPEAQDDCDEVMVFESPQAAYAFVDQLEYKLAESGYTRDSEDE